MTRKSVVVCLLNLVVNIVSPDYTISGESALAHLKTALGGWKSGTSAYELRQRKPPIDFFDSSYGLLGSELRRYEIKGLKGTDPVMRSYNFEVDLYVWYPDIREEHVHNRVFTVWRRPDGTWSISSVGD